MRKVLHVQRSFSVVVLSIMIVCLPFVVAAQNFNPLYQDGKIWFCVKDNIKLNISLEQDNSNLPVGTIPFLPSIGKNYHFTKLSKPFAAAKSSDILQRTYLLQFSDISSVQNIIEDLRATGKVEYAEMVPLDHEDLTVNDPSFSSQWYLNTINATTAWNFFSTGSTIKIAIVDNAVDRAHVDLSPNLWSNTAETASNGIDDDGNGYIDDINGFDVADNDNNPNPPNTTFDHGTHCAGIASARSNNSTGIAGIGFSTKIIAVKATANSASPSSVTNGYDGVVYAVAAGADVISMSWGGTSSSTTAQNVIAWASGQGAVLVAAAGNSNTNAMHYPAAYTQCIAVAATNSNDTKASFSNYGTWVDISAPGNNIYSTLPSNAYGNMSGTSMACPLVAGLCGLMLSLNPSLTPTDVRNCLSSSAVNIDAVNSSYVGQLGAGRIDAAAAMSCISSTLNWPPLAAFTSNVTTVTAGGFVQFTDQSVYNPTTWSWSFPGGFPVSSTQQNPTIQYNTPGTYNVTLTVTNANGNNSYTATGYIIVTAASGCIKVNLPVPGTWNLVNYYSGASVGQNGWVNGVNSTLDKQKAMYFDESTQPYTILNNVWVAFGLGYSTNPAKIVPCNIYDGTSGTPGALLGSVSTTMGQIMSDVNGNYYTEFSFVNNPITLPVSKKFFVSIDLTNLNWTTNHDTLSIVSNTDGETTPSLIWDQHTNNSWHQYTTAGCWNLSASLIIHPFLTDANSVATIAASPLTLCAGNAVAFDATGSTYEDTLLWYFPGASPLTSNNIIEQALYQNAGNYQAILYIVGGGCHLFDSAFVNITVNANPTLAVTQSPSSSSVCSGTPVSLTASGASSYIWSPATYLSATTGANVTSTPTSSISYNLQGTGANGCVSNMTIDIDVDVPPTAMVTEDTTIICEYGTVNFDGSASTGSNTFSWSFPGGTPTSSNASVAAVQYVNAGTYTATLVVQNSCGSDTVMSQTISVGCAGLNEHGVSDPVAFYNISMDQLVITLPAQGFTISVYDNLGQLVKGFTTKNLNERISTSEFASGVYTVVMSDGNGMHSMKFVK